MINSGMLVNCFMEHHFEPYSLHLNCNFITSDFKNYNLIMKRISLFISEQILFYFHSSFQICNHCNVMNVLTHQTVD